MNPITDLLASIDKMIIERGSAAILRERIIQLREEIERLVQENNRLQTELGTAKTESNQLRAALQQKTVPNEYLEHRGILLRRLPNGNIQDEIYCPDCKKPMVSHEQLLPFQCSKCGFAANFTGCDLRRIIKEVT